MLYLRLAREHGMTVRQYLASVGSDELTEQIAYERRDPCGYQRLDLLAGIICSVIANVNATKRHYKPADFMPEFGKWDSPGDPDDIKAMLMGHAEQYGSDSGE